jgi:hypothetical protein
MDENTIIGFARHDREGDFFLLLTCNNLEVVYGDVDAKLISFFSKYELF